ncbi:cytochrome P450 [Nocardia africana]
MAEFPFAELTANQLPFGKRDEMYAALHQWPEPTFRHSSGLRLVWKYSDARELLEANASAISNSNSLDPLVGYPRIVANPGAVQAFLRHLMPPPAKATANLGDDIRHKLVWDTLAGPTGHFTVTTTDREERADSLAAHFHNARAELNAGGRTTLDVTRLSISFATRVTGSAVGLPPDQWPQVAIWSGAQSGLLGQNMRGSDLAKAVTALGQLFTVSNRVVRSAGHPNADGFARRLHDAGLPRRIAVSAMANSLAAGVHTVAGTIQQGVQRLLSDPDRVWWTMLDDATRARQVAAKILQLDPGLVAWKRRTTTAVTLRSGTTLPKGPVLIMFAAANRDPEVFRNPLQLGDHGKIPLTFGFGKHVCPGKSLATLAVEIFLRELHALAPHAELSTPAASASTRKADLLFSGADVVVSM